MPDNLPPPERPDVGKVMGGLKSFQRQSVEYVFRRMYGPKPTRRFLLADEVGLGKTLVARGVIARAIEHLWDKVQRIDVVYICSNHDIARQNIKRLNVTGRDDVALASRITLLPTKMRADAVRHSRLNFVSFTPGTSFDLKSNLGLSDERALIYHVLKDVWNLRGVAPINVLTGTAFAENFRRRVDEFLDQNTIDPGMNEQFAVAVAERPKLKEEFDELCGHFHRADANITPEVLGRRNRLVGELRTLLARTCLHALQPDLIILDEFQRFKHLLADDVESEASQLAQSLFRYSDEHSEARVLLLSATPYKMYTMSQESGQDDHYADFLDTLRFLMDDPEKTADVERLLKEYRRLLYRLSAGNGAEAVSAVRDALQAALRSVMCRTERLAVTADRCGMLREIPSATTLEAGDVESYIGLQNLARALEHPDTVEYWKSAPYLLSFMDDYSLKREFKQRLGDPVLFDLVKRAMASDGIFLPTDSMGVYASMTPASPRLRSLLRDTVDAGAWRALWMPPSLPYYELADPFADLATRAFTKRLVFSSWQVVPKTIASLVSYEAERRMMTGFNLEAQNTPEARKMLRPLLNFTRSKDRLAGMPVLGLLYPSFYLAEHIDPLRLMCDQPVGDPLQLEEMVGLAQSTISQSLVPLLEGAPVTGPEDEAWYWAAPILLDLLHDREAARLWLKDEYLASRWSGAEEADELEGEEAGDAAGWLSHIDRARELVDAGSADLGRPPADLDLVLAQLSVAGPGVTALRSLARVCENAATTEAGIRYAAGRIAWGFRSMFNAPDAMSLLRGMNGAEPYWRRVLEYCLAGCLQATLDEYAHVLRESLGDFSSDPARVAGEVAEAMRAALDLRVANPGADQVLVDDEAQRVRVVPLRLRARFAMRFGDEKSDDGETVSRADQVRQAFNSPFWPMVLVTTSVGQEGLDFHTYCHAVMHWNLPPNPVDMEQREGRVHRYKGHAVRRNVAARNRGGLNGDGGIDPWIRLFRLAEKNGGEGSGLSPYWVYLADGGAVIERHVPALPLSREADRLPALRSSLAVYRMVFGQPRQEDLLAYLLVRFSKEEVAAYIQELRINISPPVSSR